jgi:hypothetical protein
VIIHFVFLQGVDNNRKRNVAVAKKYFSAARPCPVATLHIQMDSGAKEKGRQY